MVNHSLELQEGVTAFAKHIAPYNLGEGDYTLVMMVRLKGQVCFANKFTPDSSTRTNAYTITQGFSLFGESDGFISNYQVTNTPAPNGQAAISNSFSVPFYDGGCHYIAYVRNNAKDIYQNIGSIIFDGNDSTNIRSTSIINFDNTANLEFGGKYGDPYWTTGSIMNAGLWNRALTLEEIKLAAFHRISNIKQGMLGYWPMNKSLDDLSDNKNNLQVTGSASYKPCHRCVWTKGENHYTFLEVVGEQHQESDTIHTIQTFEVTSGAKGVYGGVVGGGATFDVPDDVAITVTNPSGTIYNFSSNADSLYIEQTNGNLTRFIDMNPVSGNWKVEVSSPSTSVFTFQMHSIPSVDIATSMLGALKPIYSVPTTNHTGRSLLTKFEHVAATGLAILAAGAAIAAASGIAIPAGVIYGVVAIASVTYASAQVIIKEAYDENDEFDVCKHRVSGLCHFETKPEKILFIDPGVVSDQGTSITAKWRKKHLYIACDLSVYNGNDIILSQSDVNRQKVRENLLNEDIKYVSASGHGQLNELLGYTLPDSTDKLETVLKSNNYDTFEVERKIFHFLACNTGYESVDKDAFGLGENLVKTGALAFIGYKDKYSIKASEEIIIQGHTMDEWFIICDSEIDRALLMGQTVQQAYDAAIAKFNSTIAMMERDVDNHPTAIRKLGENRDLLVVYGDPNARISPV